MTNITLFGSNWEIKYFIYHTVKSLSAFGRLKIDIIFLTS